MNLLDHKHTKDRTAADEKAERRRPASKRLKSKAQAKSTKQRGETKQNQKWQQRAEEPERKPRGKTVVRTADKLPCGGKKLIQGKDEGQGSESERRRETHILSEAETQKRKEFKVLKGWRRRRERNEVGKRSNAGRLPSGGRRRPTEYC